MVTSVEPDAAGTGAAALLLVMEDGENGAPLPARLGHELQDRRLEDRLGHEPELLLGQLHVRGARPARGLDVVADVRLRVPAQIVVPAGAKSTRFSAGIIVSDRDEESRITAAVEGVVTAARLQITGIRPTSLVCLPKVVQAGEDELLHSPIGPVAKSVALYLR